MPDRIEYSLLLVRVFVRDFERAIDFYTNRLGMKLGFRSDELGWAQLETGACQLALEREGEEKDLVGRFVGVSISVPDIYAAHETLAERGVEFLAPPEVMPWGGVLAHFRDPDGNVLTLVGEPKSGS